MDSWRKQGGQDAARTRSNYRKPPLGGSSNWQQSVPSWEKRFCTSVGTIPWRKFLDMKRFVYLYDNVIKWNDSAGEEAFRNAKDRFYADTHGLACDVPLPDPDTYIDEIDWNSQVDPNLILDLESDSVAPDPGADGEPVVIFGDDFPSKYQNFSPFGWGDSGDDKKKDADANANAHTPPDNVIQWDDGKEWGGVGNTSNNWCGWNEKDEKVKGDQGWGGNVYDDNNYFYGDERREGGGRYMSRYRTSRFRGDEAPRNHRSRRNYGNGRRPAAAGPWRSNHYCTPVTAGSSGKCADQWSVKKHVS